ncbi:PREDICTED: myb-like protein AA [Rhagoletis zephyria]|uniref:myb-like protein AA n=1 Tax=Rhagoletis zephyria TaxID=28612 RepID=UPI0008114C9D|nr:PREDICTED: myb-like protein AA [Rhagoletis zephyria]
MFARPHTNASIVASHITTATAVTTNTPPTAKVSQSITNSSNNYYNNSNNNKSTAPPLQSLINNNQHNSSLPHYQASPGLNAGGGGGSANSVGKLLNSVSGLGLTMPQQLNSNSKNNHAYLLPHQHQQTANTLQQHTPQQQRHQQTLPPPSRQSHSYAHNNNNNNNLNRNLTNNVVPNISTNNLQQKQTQQTYSSAAPHTQLHMNGAPTTSTMGATPPLKAQAQPQHKQQQHTTAIANNSSKINGPALSATSMFFVRPANPPLHIGELPPFVPVQLF